MGRKPDIKLCFEGKIHETESSKGICLNSIKVRLRGGRIITLDRDRTDYTVSNGRFTMEWSGVYIWNSGTIDREYIANSNNVELLLGLATGGIALVDYTIDEDTDVYYELDIESMSVKISDIPIEIDWLKKEPEEFVKIDSDEN